MHVNLCLQLRICVLIIFSTILHKPYLMFLVQSLFSLPSFEKTKPPKEEYVVAGWAPKVNA